MRFNFSSFFYTKVIDPILAGGQRRIVNSLEPGDRVIDIACGTGSLSMAMSEICTSVLGIDLSDEMIELATDTAARKKAANVAFELRDAIHLSHIKDKSFDKAVTSMAVHQFDHDLAISILKEMKRISNRVVIMDYNWPLNNTAWKTVIWIIEWIAGGDHYRNFRNYNRLGGLTYFLERAGLEADVKELYHGSSFRVVIC